MATIRKEFEVNSDVNSVWEKIADTGNISQIIGFVSESQQSGDQRVCKLDNGATLVEKIISVNEGLKRVVYSITESPLNMEFQVASMELEASGGKTKFVWTADLLPDAAAEALEPMMDSAVADMSKTLA